MNNQQKFSGGGYENSSDTMQNSSDNNVDSEGSEQEQQPEENQQEESKEIENVEQNTPIDEYAAESKDEEQIIASIENKDEKNGTFQVIINGVTDAKQVLVPVWCDKKQQDIVWYTAKKDVSGQYYVDVDIANHRYNTGDYNVHVYMKKQDDTLVFLTKTETAVTLSAGKMTIENIDGTETIFKAYLSDLNTQGMTDMQIAVWSEENSQDDLQWYSAKKAGDDYNLSIPIRNHKSMGKYYVHAYMKDYKGGMHFLDNTEFQVSGVDGATVKIDKENVSKGTFRVTVEGIENAEKVQIPVWCDENQKDIIWYDAKKGKSDAGKEIYYTDVDIANHQYSLGEYKAHVYVTKKNGVFAFAGRAENKEIEISTDNISAIDKDGDGTVFTVDLSNVSTQGMSSVKAAVWSAENGQDDIVWYDMKAKGNGYTVDVPIRNHKHIGDYNVHVYLQDKRGGMHFLTKTAFKVTICENAEVHIEKQNASKGTFRVVVEGVKGAKKVQIPVWCDKNQKDIVWYDAKKEGSKYYADVNIANHKYNLGNYQAHVYITTLSNVLCFIGNTSTEVNVFADSLTATDANGTERTYQLSAAGTNTQGMIDVQIAVWSVENGQDDIRWYAAKKVNDTEYQLNVDVQNHKSAGEYNAHAYLKDKNGGMHFLAKTTFNVQKATAEMSISDIDNNRGIFKVTVKNINAPSGVQRVQIPVWCSSNQSDIMWYDAQQQEDGTYTAIVRVANHQHHFGTYTAHVYVTTGNGIMNFTCSDSATLEAKNYVGITKLDNYRAKIVVVNPEGNNITRVQFPTWSNTNGQDDIIWYEGTNEGDGVWSTVIESGKHKHDGNYTTHVYITDTDGTRAIGSKGYSLARFTIVDVRNSINAADGSRDITTFGGYSMSAGVWNQLQRAVNNIRGKGYDIGFVMIDLGTGKGVACNPNGSFFSASTIKSPYITSVISANPNSIWQWMGTMQQAITLSNNTAYATLRRNFGPSSMQNWCVQANVDAGKATYDYPFYTAKDLAKLWTRNYEYFQIGPHAATLQSWHRSPKNSAIAQSIGSVYTTYSKPGWYEPGDGHYATNDAGIVYAPNGTYIMAILTNMPNYVSDIISVVYGIENAHKEM